MHVRSSCGLYGAVYPLETISLRSVFILLVWRGNAVCSVFVFINSKVILVTENNLFCNTVYYWVLTALAAEGAVLTSCACVALLAKSPPGKLRYRMVYIVSSVLGTPLPTFLLFYRIHFFKFDNVILDNFFQHYQQLMTYLNWTNRVI